MTSRARQRSKGFTLVEVMVSLGVMTIGAMAMLAMQQQTVRGNVQARQMTTATQIAQNWIERLKMDGLFWRSVTGVPATDLANTLWLKQITAVGADGTFQTFQAMPTGVGVLTMTNGNDYYGDDTAVGANAAAMANVVYCSAYRLSWIQLGRIMRADVRVWWANPPRTADLGAFPSCANSDNLLNPVSVPAAGSSAALTTMPDGYHIVYLSTALRAQRIGP